MSEKPFIHLHNHDLMSVNDGMIKIKPLAKRLKELEMDTFAITNHGTMLDVLFPYMELKKEGIKTIIGLETYMAPRKNTLKESGIDGSNYHLVLLAENNKGYQNLLKIASNAATEGFYRNARTDKDILREYHEGLIASSACLGGEIQKAIINFGVAEAKKIALEYDDIFGRGNFFLEMQEHGLEDQHAVNEALIQIHQETGIPMTCTNDCHYLDASDYEAHDVLMAIQAKVTIDDKTHRKVYESDQFYVKSAEEMWNLFSGTRYGVQALQNTVEIGKRCDVTIDFSSSKLPPFHVPESFHMENSEFLRHLTYKGMQERYGEDAEKHKERVEFELQTINDMGFVNYFLITWDFFRFCRDGTDNADDPPNPSWKPIACGPGRGSGAGSIVLYSLYITHIDPIKYNLLFERFLDPSRISMPEESGIRCELHCSKVCIILLTSTK